MKHLTSRAWPSTASTRARATAARPAWPGGQRVPKDSARIEAYGTVDELNAFVGAARVTAIETGAAELAGILLRVQHELFNLGSILATLPEDVHPKQARVTDAEVTQLEAEMDRANADLRAAALVRSAGRQPAQRGAAHLPDRVPAGRARLCHPGAPGNGATRSGALPEPAERRAVCLEPLVEPPRRRARNFMGTEPVHFGAE